MHSACDSLPAQQVSLIQEGVCLDSPHDGSSVSAWRPRSPTQLPPSSLWPPVYIKSTFMQNNKGTVTFVFKPTVGQGL